MCYRTVQFFVRNFFRGLIPQKAAKVSDLMYFMVQIGFGYTRILKETVIKPHYYTVGRFLQSIGLRSVHFGCRYIESLEV